MFNLLRNMSFIEYVKSHKYLSNSFCRYSHVYKNYLDVIIHILRNKYPIRAILHDGRVLMLNNYYEVYLTSFGLMRYCKIENQIITIKKENLPELKFDLGQNNGDIQGVFFDEVYKFLPVKENVVVDIGANIADSAIYFAVNGASKVIALEPFVQNYEIAQKNVELNNLEDKIELLLAGCSDKDGFISVHPKKQSAGVSLKNERNGVNIPLMTLDTILKKYGIDSAVLKLDCEGCEYEAIMSSSDETLKKFSHIQLEYHYGYRNLKQKLEKIGFKVSVTKPSFIVNMHSRKVMYFGYLYAQNN